MAFDITARIEVWRAQLLDTTRRNRLINFQTGRGGGIALVHPDPGELWHRLVAGNGGLTFPWKRDLIDLPDEPAEPGPDAGPPLVLFDPEAPAPEPEPGVDVLERCRHSPRLRPGHLLTELPDKQLAARLARLALAARESHTEQGVGILYVAFGFLRWFESADSGVEYRSPLLLVPVRLERDSVEAPWRLRAEDEDPLPNQTLAQLFAHDFRLRLPLPEEDGDPDDPAWRTGYFGEVERLVQDMPRWEVLDEVALGTFRFQKLAMWDDLARNRERIAAHDLCRAIAGDPAVALRCPPDLPRAEELDQKTDPAHTFHILDADSSQHEAIVAAERGASLVLDGPPGTGKSQTIANVIAEFLAAGKTVLFVSEKAAALEVVQRRLRDKGLGDFCLACHSHKANKREVVAELGRCLALEPGDFHDPADDLQRLAEARGRLNDYVRELHAARPPLGLSAFQVHGELARLARLAGTSRCPVPQVLERDAGYLRKLTDLLAGLPDCRAVIEGRDPHPWRGCRAAVYSLTLRDDIRHHFGRLADGLGQAAEATAVLHELGFGGDNPTRAEWLRATETARAVLACPLVPAAWFRADPRPVAEAVVRLDQQTRAYRERLAGLTEFRADALGQADATVLAELTPPAEEAGPHLLFRPGETMRPLRRRLAGVADGLRELQRRAAAADQAARQVVALLRVPLPALPVKGLGRLAELAEAVARTKPVRRSWWDAGRRPAQRGAHTRWQEEARTAQALRTELAARQSPRAFAPESAALATRAAGFRSFLSRLLPGWWSVKARVAEWYPGELPTTAALLDDLGKLAGYHRRVDYCRQVREQYAADLLPGGDAGPDWAGTLEGLDAVDRLEQLAGIPAALREHLAAEGALDRPALAAAAETLAQNEAALRQQLGAVARDCDFGAVTDGGPLQVRRSAGEFAAWLEGQAADVAKYAARLEKVEGLLVEGRDLAVEVLPARLRVLGELARLRSEVAQLAGRIWQPSALPGVEGRDWSALRAGAEGLLGLLGRWPGGLPDPVVQAVTVPATRERLAEAVRRSDAARAGGFDESLAFLAGLFDLNQEVSTGIVIEKAPLADLRRWLTGRVEDADRLREWTRFREAEREMAAAGVGPLLDEVLAGRVKVDEAADAFRARFFRLWLDALYERVPALRQFATDRHERLIGRFRELDRAAVASAAGRIRHLQLTRSDRPRAFAGEAPGSSELGTLLREVNKKRRHLPLRKLFAALPTLLPRLKPCLMMSPLAVSTYLESPDLHFDLVIFDEASQVRPHDAVCAIYRGRQLLVAGDQKQLPPTDFFERSLDDGDGDGGEDGAALEDFESILDVCCTLGLPRRRLRWHYRSRREGLIAFANHHVYDNELVTFPSVHDTAGNPAVAFEPVAAGRWKAGAGGGFNAVEARRTAELVVAHFREQLRLPEAERKSLGVIAFSQRQQLRILDELERLRRASPELEEFFAEDREEPFFVKNLENVQGDERDVIFLGVGYGPDETGRVALRFGPLNQQGGERRLNVAVTRARERMVVVSSMRARDIDLSRTGARGVRLLRDYLDYAERGPEALGTGATVEAGRGFDSPFEREVFEELTRRGLAVHPQVGCSGFRIDLAVVDPRAPGRYLLGVECDGRTYHSSATARDRDRLRQEVLESLGWRICRVWSTDWLRDREGQVRRVREAVEQARQEPAALPPAGPPGRTAPPQTEAGSAPADGQAGAASSAPADFESIDDVPGEVLRDVLLGALRTFGATEAGELIRAATHQLGFARTGRRIKERAEECLEGLVQGGRVCRAADGRLQLAAPQPPEAVSR